MDETQAKRTGENVTDLANLWQAALEEYADTTKLDLTKKVYRSASDILDDTEIQDNFRAFRRKDGKVDKLRDLVKNNTDLILSGATAIAEAAAVAFPPSTIIVTALAFVMNASKEVSKHYDMITDFFDNMNSFLKRVKIVEGRVPRFEGYRGHLMEVFAALLKTCGVATKATDVGRLQLFAKKAIGWGGRALEESIASLETALKRLESATAFQILAYAVKNEEDTGQVKAGLVQVRGVAEDIRQDTGQVKAGLVQVRGVAEDIRQDAGQLKSNLQEVMGAVSDIAAGISQLNVRDGLVHKADAEGNREIVAKIDLLLDMQKMSASKKAESEALPVSESVHKKHTAFSIVKQAFASLEDPQLRDRDFEHAWVLGTTDWFTSMPRFVSWMKENHTDDPFLWISGSPGVGKSWLAYAAVQALQRWTASDSTCSVAHIYFRHDALEQGALRELTKCAVTQIAALDRAYCEHVAAELKRANGKVAWTSPNAAWEKYVASRYKQDSAHRLYLVLDGVDELPQSPRPLFNALKRIIPQRLNMRVLLFSRPRLSQFVKILHPSIPTFKIEKANIEDDMRRVIDSRLESSFRLRKLRGVVKRCIVQTLVHQATSMLYIDNVLRRLNRLHGERAVLRCLCELPSSTEGLYTMLEDEIRSKRTPEQLQSLKIFFAWLAHSYHRVNMSEIQDVLKLCGQDTFFSAEEELQGPSARVLEVISTIYGSDDQLSQQPIAAEDDGEDEAEHGSRNDLLLSLEQTPISDDSIVRFYHRAMRDFFRTEDGREDSIRMAPTTAHIMFFEMCVKIIGGQYTGQLSSSLRKYAAHEWATHLRAFTANADLVADADVPRVTGSLISLLQNEHSAASFFELEYTPDQGRSLYSDSLARRKVDRASLYHAPFLQWADRVLRCLDLGADGVNIRKWAEQVRAEPTGILVELARGHVRNWFTQPGREQVSYKCAIFALNMTSLVPEEHNDSEDNPASKVMAIARVFSGIPLSAAAHRAIAIILSNSCHYDHAEEACQESLRQCGNEADRFETLVQLAHVQRSMAQNQAVNDPVKIVVEGSARFPSVSNKTYVSAHETIQQAIDVAPPLKDKHIQMLTRRALILRADCELRLRLFDNAVRSLEEAKRVIPEEQMEGDALAILPLSMANSGQYERILDLTKDWSIFDYMAWLISDPSSTGDQNPNIIFQHAASLAGMETFAIEVYEQIIAFLGTRGAAGYVQIYLGQFYYHVLVDTEKAKQTWLQALHSNVHIDPATGEQDEETVTAARLGLTDAMYQQFRASSNPLHKLDLLADVRRLQDVWDGEPPQEQDMAETATAIILANMIRKVGSAQEYQKILSEVFDTCIIALTDSEGWNDQTSLRLLAQVLASVGGLDTEAQILYSAQFSILDSTLSGRNVDAEGSANRPTTHEWGQLAPQSGVRCCGDEKVFNDWSNGPIYMCLICANLELCQQCYERIQTRKRGTPWEYWKQYCGVDHKYMRGPIEGWKGIEDGCMMIDEEKTMFQDWLLDLRERKWKMAWDRFWLREEGLQNIV